MDQPVRPSFTEDRLMRMVRCLLAGNPSVSLVDFWRRDDLVPFRAAWGQAGSTETEKL